MKTSFARFLAVIFLSAFALLPLRAQTNLSAEAGVDSAASAEILPGDSDEVKIKKLEMQKDMEANRLDYERHMSDEKLDTTKGIIHDLVWGSWVLVVLALVAVGYFRNRMAQETLRLMIEKGQPLTPELVIAIKSKNRSRGAHDPQGYLALGGLIAGVGAGLLLIHQKAGWVVLLIGAAYLVLWLVERGFSRNGQLK
jgi:hypothetical protein